MPRIPTKPYNNYPWYIRWLFRSQKKTYGKILNSALVWARSPKVFLGLSTFYGALNRKSSPLDPELRRLVIVHVSQINACAFCIDLNTSLLKSKDKLSPDEQSPKEKAALTYTKAVIHSKVTDKVFESLKEHFTDDEIVELTALICFQDCSTKFNTALDIPAQGFQKH